MLITTEENKYPAVIGIKCMISGGGAQTGYGVVVATALLALIPPTIVVVLTLKS